MNMHALQGCSLKEDLQSVCKIKFSSCQLLKKGHLPVQGSSTVLPWAGSSPFFRSPACLQWEASCDPLQIHSRLPAALFVNDPVASWNLWHVPRHWGRRKNIWRNQGDSTSGKHVPAKMRYPNPPPKKCIIYQKC